LTDSEGEGEEKEPADDYEVRFVKTRIFKSLSLALYKLLYILGRQ
jgi:hypothetical protein